MQHGLLFGETPEFTLPHLATLVQGPLDSPWGFLPGRLLAGETVNPKFCGLVFRV